MKIGFLTQYYPPEMGAPQARLSELAQCFVQRGHQVVVLTAMPNYPQGRLFPGYGGLWRRERQEAVETIRTFIYPSKSVNLLPRLSNYFSFVGSSALVGAVALPRLDYLLTESPPLFLGLSGYGLSRLKRARWIFNVSDLWPESAVHLGVLGEGISLRLAYQLEAFCYRNAWLVSGQSREILANIQRRFPSVPTYHLSNGVDTNRFYPSHPATASAGGRADGRCVVIYAGLHGIAQGLDQVVAAAYHLTDLPNLEIVLVGDGPQKEALMAQAQGLSNVRFLDSQPRGVIPALLSSADIAIVPLKTHLPGAVPSKIYEAMAAALPIVLVAEDEPAQIVRNAGAGLVVPPGDPQQLAAALRALALDPRKRRQMGVQGRKAAEERYDRTKIADAFIDYLERHRAC